MFSPNEEAGVTKGSKQSLLHHAEGSEPWQRILARDLLLQLRIIKILLRENKKQAPDTFLLIKVLILERGAKFKNKQKRPIELINKSKCWSFWNKKDNFLTNKIKKKIKYQEQKGGYNDKYREKIQDYKL